MEKKILEQLEFEKVKEQFWPYLQTEQGQLELDLLEPIANKDKIQAYFTELEEMAAIDRKSTRLNSSHANISYAVFCLKKKKKTHFTIHPSLSSYFHLFSKNVITPC